MKRSSFVVALLVTLGSFALDADAARRFGGGGNVGKQRAAPTATKDAAAPAAQPAQAAPASPAAAPAGVAPKPSFMQRWGGMLAGLGIGVLLASLFGAQLGPIIGMLLAVLLVAVIGFALFRLFAGRKAPPARDIQFAGIGSGVQTPPSPGPATPRVEIGSALRDTPAAAAARPAIDIPGFEVAPFVRVAKTSFIRMQDANDRGDLDDIRDFTTPELYAEVAMQLRERGDAPQKTEVVSLDANVIEAVVEDGYEIASVRFWGLLRENNAANPEPFDETWHVRRKAGDAKASWLIAGIQQNTP
jgi:predicted lipid-binding transport protein (Tim44 family)